MEIDNKIGIDYDGNIHCDICGRELKDGEEVETIQKGMRIDELGDGDTMVQFGEDSEVYAFCKDCSPKVVVIVK